MKKCNRRVISILIGIFSSITISCSAFAAEISGPGAAGSAYDAADHTSADSARDSVLICGEEASRISEEELALSGPGVSADSRTSEENENGAKGESLGMFTTTGYCNCESCCPAGWTLTYSGTVPKNNHTISADINRYPIGTRLMIGDTIYTVEDMGSHVSGNWIDVYYDTHEDAVAHGKKELEVFTVIPSAAE